MSNGKVIIPIIIPPLRFACFPFCTRVQRSGIGNDWRFGAAGFLGLGLGWDEMDGKGGGAHMKVRYHL